MKTKLKGSLKKETMHEILSKLSGESKTGMLEVKSGKNRSRILFHEGAIVCAVPSPLKNIMEPLLKWEPAITPQAPEISQKLNDEINTLTEQLLSNNLISIESLRNFFNVNTKNVIFDLFLLQKGKYKFIERDINYNKELFPLLNTDFLNMESAKIMDELLHISGFYPGDDVIPEKTEEPSSKFMEELTDAEKLVLSKIDGNTTCAEILYLTRIPFLEGKIAIAWLNQKHLIKLKPSRIPFLAKIKRVQNWIIRAGASFVFIFLIVLSFLVSPLNPLKSREVKETVRFYKLYSAISSIQQNKIATALELYRWEKGTYPPDLKSLVDEKILLKQDLTYPWGKEYYYNMSENGYILLQPGR